MTADRWTDDYLIDADLARDHATFAWLCDVYVDPDHRGRGLGKRLTDAVVDTLRPLALKRTMLATLDAHAMYARVGFVPVADPEMLMILEAEGERSDD